MDIFLKKKKEEVGERFCFCSKRQTAFKFKKKKCETEKEIAGSYTLLRIAIAFAISPK